MMAKGLGGKAGWVRLLDAYTAAHNATCTGLQASKTLRYFHLQVSCWKLERWRTYRGYFGVRLWQAYVNAAQHCATCIHSDLQNQTINGMTV